MQYHDCKPAYQSKAWQSVTYAYDVSAVMGITKIIAIFQKNNADSSWFGRDMHSFRSTTLTPAGWMWMLKKLRFTEKNCRKNDIFKKLLKQKNEQIQHFHDVLLKNTGKFYLPFLSCTRTPVMFVVCEIFVVVFRVVCVCACFLRGFLRSFYVVRSPPFVFFFECAWIDAAIACCSRQCQSGPNSYLYPNGARRARHTTREEKTLRRVTNIIKKGRRKPVRI